MNIFVVEDCPIKCARALPDKLVVKMPLESAQMLSTAHRLLSPHEYCEEMSLYKKAYYNHPCTIWARETDENYRWLLIHWISLCEEYYHRYGKYHASWVRLWDGLKIFPMNITEGDLTPFAQAMPAKYKNDCAVTAYRAYYHGEKADFATWKSEVPQWWTAA